MSDTDEKIARLEKQIALLIEKNQVLSDRITEIEPEHTFLSKIIWNDVGPRIKKTEGRVTDLEARHEVLRDFVREEIAEIRKRDNISTKNDLFIFEKLYPLFQKVFPNDWKFREEFEKILGKETGPEEPKRDSKKSDS